MATYPSNPAEPREDRTALPPGRLWRHLPVERRQAVARAFWTDPEGAEHQADALGWMAREMKFRLKTLARLPLEKKVQHLAALRGVPDTVAVRALVAYHLASKREMMGVFLDALGVAHDHGVIDAESPTPPAREALVEAARALREKYAKEDVDLYFSTLLAQDPNTWGGLHEVLDAPAAGNSSA